MLANAAMLAGWDVQLSAARRFGGKPPAYWLGPAVGLGWVLLCQMPTFLDSYVARVVVANMAAALLSGLLVAEITGNWGGQRSLRFLVIAVSGPHTLVAALRPGLALLLGPDAVAATNPALMLSGLATLVTCTVFVTAEVMRRTGEEAQAALAVAHAEAAASRDLLAYVIDAMPCAIYVARMRPGAEGQRTFLSANTERVIGWPRAALDAPNALDLRTDQTAAERDAARAILAEHGEFVRELQMRRPDGSRFWVRRHSRIAARHPDGTCDVVGTITDITRERDLAAQVQASAKLATLGEMVANLAHELGQPAATMCLAAGNAAKALRNRGEAAIPDALKRLERIIAQGERMGALMQHLKAFARAEPLKLGPVPVAKAVEGALVLTEAGLRQEEIALELDLPPDLPPVQGQLVPLEQVLVNLLLNARDAVRRLPQGVSRRIRLHAGQQGEDRVTIEVADTGGGIDPAVLPRFFEPFFTTKPMGEGLGLGLSVSHGLVGGMGGSIAAENRENGAVVTVTLACAPALVPA